VFSAYRSVLSIPGALRLLSSALLGRLPQGMSTLAILLLVRGATHSYAAAGVAVGADALASAALAPLQGRLVDRFGRVKVLAPAALVQAVVLIGLALAGAGGAPAGVLIPLSGLAGAVMPPIAPSVRALLREVVSDPELRERAYALESVTQELIWIVGPLVVALIITVVSPAAALVVVAVIGVGGTLLFVRSPLARVRAQRPPRHERTAALANAQLRALLGPIALTGFGLGTTEVGLPSLALHAGARADTGVLLALWSVGSVLGGLWYGSRTWRSPLAARYRTLLVVAVVLTAPLIAARSVASGAALSLLSGLTIAPVFACQYALVGRAVTAGNETEAFTWVTSALVGGLAAGSAAGGVAISAGGVGAPFALSCLASLSAAVLAVGMRTRVQALA
jgi:predicted MFS family arabinose efflux permease